MSHRPFLAVALPPEIRLSGAVEGVPDTAGDSHLATVAPTPDELGRLLAALLAGSEALGALPVERIADTLGAVGGRFLASGDELRERALELLPDHARVSPAQARTIVDGMARDWTADRLHRLLRAELGEPGVLDGFRTLGGGVDPARRLRAHGPRLALHVCAGTVPGVSATSLIRGLLVKGAVLLKPGAGDAVLPILFRRGLARAGDVGEALAAASAVVYWRGGSRAIEDPVLGVADQVVVYGGDDTVAELRGRVRPGTALVDYPHRVSVAVLGPDVDPERVAGDLARAVAAFDQRGCVSPRQVLLPGAGPDAAEAWADALARALERARLELPPGPPTPDEAAAVHQLRGAVEMRAAAGEPVTLHAGEGLSWTVVVDPRPRFEPGCSHRTLHVTPLPDRGGLEAVLGPVARHLQTVGVAGFGTETEAWVERLAGIGASRVVPLDQVAFPPAWWLHDGRGPLRRLLRWTESGLEEAT